MTQPWTDARFVPQQFREIYVTAFSQLSWAGEKVSRLVFVLLVAVRNSSLSDAADRIRALAGPRFDEVKEDDDFTKVVACMLQDDPASWRGAINDVRNVFCRDLPTAVGNGSKRRL